MYILYIYIYISGTTGQGRTLMMGTDGEYAEGAGLGVADDAKRSRKWSAIFPPTTQK
jgi:hypothetical protein